MRYDAFFISPEGEIIPVVDRHIVRIVRAPKDFNLTVEEIKAVYRKHNEDVGWEGFARDEIIWGLLKKDWVRLRFMNRSGTWTVQIGEKLNPTLAENILLFCREVKGGNIRNCMHRTADPHIKIVNTSEDELFRGPLNEGIRFLSEDNYLVIWRVSDLAI